MAGTVDRLACAQDRSGRDELVAGGADADPWFTNDIDRGATRRGEESQRARRDAISGRKQPIPQSEVGAGLTNEARLSRFGDELHLIVREPQNFLRKNARGTLRN